MKLIFVPPNDPILNKIAEPIKLEEIQEKKYQELIDSMLELGNWEQKNNHRMSGLAAPQIGFSKRIIIVDLIADGSGKLGGLTAFINPEIVWQSKTTEEYCEGCFSTDEIRGIVERSTKVKVKFLDIKGRGQEKTFENFTARIFQHEIDHLNGKEFISHITDEKKLHWVNWNEAKDYRKNQAWRNWPHKATFEEWKKIKNAPI